MRFCAATYTVRPSADTATPQGYQGFGLGRVPRGKPAWSGVVVGFPSVPSRKGKARRASSPPALRYRVRPSGLNAAPNQALRTPARATSRRSARSNTRTSCAP